MKTIKILYWASTVLAALMFVMSSIMYLTHNPQITEGLKSLGYPVYILGILGTAKLIGSIVLVVPRFPVLKEWAYAGFVIDLIGAVWSHAAVGQFSQTVGIALPFALLAISYVTYHRLHSQKNLVIAK